MHPVCLTPYILQNVDSLHESLHGLPGVPSLRPTFDRLPVITQHRKCSSSGGAQISTNEKTLMYQSTNSQKHSFVKYLNAKYLYCSAMIYSQFSILNQIRSHKMKLFMTCIKNIKIKDQDQYYWTK